MGSRPIVEVEIGGELLPHVLSVTFEQPEGAASSACSIRFAGPSVAPSTTTSVVVRFGYAVGGLDTLLDTAEMQSSQYSIVPRSDGLTVTWVSALDRLQRRAPFETEIWDGKGRTLKDFARYVGEKVGYTTLRENLPPIPMPAETRIEPEDGYWNALQKILDPLHPLILPDDTSATLHIWWLDAAIAGSPLTLPIARAESVAIPKTVRQKVNVALLKYLVAGNDGGTLKLDCAQLGDTFDDGTDEYIGVTSAACAVQIDPEANADIVSRTSYETAPAAESGEGAQRVRREEVFAVPLDENDKPLGSPVVIKSVTTMYASDDIAEVRPKERTTATFSYIKGTNYQMSAGHRSKVEAAMPVPLAGLDAWVDDLYSETETVEYLVTKEHDLVKYRTIKQSSGRVLEPDHIPLYEAGTNGTVRVDDDTFQWTVSAQDLAWEIEELIPMGGSAKYQRRRYNYLTGRWEGPGDQGDVSGRVPSTADLQPRTVEESYPDPAIPLDDEEHPIEPADGWQIPVIIDGTWIGTGLLLGLADEPLLARDWCIRMADAMFRRAGSRIATYTATVAKYLSKVRRGGVITAARRGQANPHKAVVTRVAFIAEWQAQQPGSPAGGYLVRTEITARRLEAGDDAG